MAARAGDGEIRAAGKMSKGTRDSPIEGARVDSKPTLEEQGVAAMPADKFERRVAKRWRSPLRGVRVQRRAPQGPGGIDGLAQNIEAVGPPHPGSTYRRRASSGWLRIRQSLELGFSPPCSLQRPFRLEIGPFAGRSADEAAALLREWREHTGGGCWQPAWRQPAAIPSHASWWARRSVLRSAVKQLIGAEL
jgi:hypothetical protein